MRIPKPDNYPHFLVIEFLEETRPIASQSMFLISKFLENILGGSYKAKKQRNGEILVELHSQQQTTKLLKQTRIADLDVNVTHHRSLNSWPGVLSEVDLANDTKADLPKGLKIQGVKAVRRITIRRDDKVMPQNISS